MKIDRKINKNIRPYFLKDFLVFLYHYHSFWRKKNQKKNNIRLGGWEINVNDDKIIISFNFKHKITIIFSLH